MTGSEKVSRIRRAARAVAAFGPWRRLGRELLVATAVGIVALVLGAIALRLAPEMLTQRWTSGIADDNTLHYLVATTAVDSPFLGPNDRLGFPNSSELFFAPLYDPVTAVVLTVLGALLRDGVTALNVYQVLAFFSVGFAASLLFSTLRVRRSLGVLLALVFALAPFHLQRVAFGHAFVANYWAVAVAVVLVLMAGGPRTNPFEGWIASASSTAMRRARRWIPILVLTLAVSLSLSYYFVFAVILMGGVILAGAVRALATRGGWRELGWPIATTGMLAGFVVVQLAVLSLDFGERYERYFAGRSAELSEMHAGRITSLLLPWTGTGFGPLASISSEYAEGSSIAPFAEPPGTPIVASIGMVLLMLFILGRLVLLRLPARDTRIGALVADERVGAVSAAFLWGLLFYITSGLGFVFAAVVSPELRAWVRMSIFLIAFALVFLGLVLDRVLHRRGVRLAVVAGLAAVALVDQIAGARGAIDLAPSDDAGYRAFVAAAEESLDTDCGVAQLPVQGFPEGGPVGAMPDYNEALPYLLSSENTLRWSYGAVRGTRAGDFWADAGTPAAFGDAVAESGACAVLVDRLAYSDDPEGWEPFVAAVADPEEPLLESGDADHRYLLFEVRG
ncbi:MAG: hypothetical protein QM675_01855 [Protaetiibacter sp.]